MSFFEQPILNSPYRPPEEHWELDDDGRPTDTVIGKRRRSDLISAVPEPKSVKGVKQSEMELSTAGLEGQDMAYNVTEFVNEMRSQVDAWRQLPNPNDWQVSPITQRLLQHWRAIQKDEKQVIRPFFCQLEAVETAIWMTEVAPKMGERGRRIRRRLEAANAEANPDLFRVAMKLATGAGKTTVMAMLIAWQTLNAVRSPNSKTFSRGFLIVTPGITIRDRLRVLLPNDADSYYQKLNLVPGDLMQDMQRAKIVLTNYHAFKLRERMQLAKGTRSALEGHGETLTTLETEGQMLQRVMPELMGLGRINVINDEAHHCYRERPDAQGPKLTGDERKEAEENAEAARLWISGIEAAKRKLGVKIVYDLSATPFFLSGSGWVEGTLFPWVIPDFSLMDAFECGIVKLPRVPVADNMPGQPEPLYRKLWDVIGKKMPKKARRTKPDPQSLPIPLKTAIDALYGHYEKTFKLWQAEGVGIPPVFIVVCNNTTNSELLRALANDGPIIGLVNTVFSQAVQSHASDVHIEATETGGRVRFRVHGRMQVHRDLSDREVMAVVSRIKVMSGLNISEKHLPQDGRAQVVVRGGPVDLRIACLPTQFGESVVIRILDRRQLVLDWDTLGFDPDMARQIEGIVNQPNGLFLVAGPTGSGKTTTLYTALSGLNSDARKIVTVEDPIEYSLPGINQVAVDTERDLGFARALRAILRQDPDVIMVGEIRDEETAAIAVRAALVGRMVLSTIHTNDGPSTVNRLLDLGMEEYLLRDTLRGVLSQRLEPVRCEGCGGAGCETCGGGGQVGRRVVADLMRGGAAPWGSGGA